MRLQPQVPTVQDAVQHFKAMAEGQLPRRIRRKGKLYGGWGGMGPSTMKTTLVTPTAQAVEQAKSQLKREGVSISTKRQKTQGKKKTSKTKKMGIKAGGIKKKAHSRSRQRRGKKYQDNFS